MERHQNTGRGVTGSVVNAVSSVGVVDAVGRVWEWLDELITRAEHATNADYLSLIHICIWESETGE